MIRCPHCNHENADVNVFCGKCGTFFETFVEYKPSLDEYAEEMGAGASVGGRRYRFRPPRERYANSEVGSEKTAKVPETQAVQTTWITGNTAHTRVPLRRRRMSRRAMFVFRALRVLFYFVVAVPLALFGLFNAIISVDNSTPVASLALFCAAGFALVSLAVFYRIRNRWPSLSWIQFLLFIAIATSGWMMSMLFESVLIPDFSERAPGQVVFSLLFLFYGCMLAAVALW